MKRVKLGIAVMVGVCIASMFIGWCCGFNFDHRTSDVGMWVGVTLAIAIVFGGVFLAE